MAKSTPLNQQKKRIFLIDDDQSLLKMYSIKLNQLNFEVATTTAPKKAIEEASAFQPDIIFLDIVMPGADGLDVLKKIKETTATKWIPVVMLTNTDNASDKAMCEKEGASGYIVKANITPSELGAYAEKVLEKPR